MALPFPSLSTIASAPAVVDSVVGWLWTLALFLFPGLVAAGLCAPFLAAERLRELFRALPRTGGS